VTHKHGRFRSWFWTSVSAERQTLGRWDMQLAAVATGSASLERTMNRLQGGSLTLYIPSFRFRISS